MSTKDHPIDIAVRSDENPIVVDLDESLLRTDLLYESVVALLRINPLYLFVLPIWLTGGIAHMKRQVARRVDLDVSSLPVNEAVFEFITEEHRRGRTLLLATASDRLVAERIGKRFGLFARVIASDGHSNLKGERKLAEIRAALGSETDFEYLGDSRSDLVVFRASSVAHLVNPTRRLLDSAKKAASIGRIFKSEDGGFARTLLKTLRVHQWVKNLLLFLPAILAHRTFEPVMVTVLLSFIAFSLVASATYVVNDLLDLDADRKHPINRMRPIASGRIRLLEAVALMIVCFLAGGLLAVYMVPGPFVAVMALYAISSVIYSLYLKRLMIIDVIVLASLYSVRIIAGGVAAAIEISGWLLSFSVFFFLGLALLKRYVELVITQSDGTPGAARAYVDDDISFIGIFGVVSGMLAVLVFVLYLNSSDVVVLYSKPRLLWWVNLPLIYWTMRMWLNAARGRIQSDPILSALRDPVSYVCGGAVVTLLVLAIG